MIERERSLSAFLWLWVATVLVAYLWQFRDLAGPILAVLGLGDTGQ